MWVRRDPKEETPVGHLKIPLSKGSLPLLVLTHLSGPPAPRLLHSPVPVGLSADQDSPEHHHVQLRYLRL